MNTITIQDKLILCGEYLAVCLKRLKAIPLDQLFQFLETFIVR